MPTPSKFTEARRRLILAALGVGASRRTAAKLAGVDHQTLGRWIERGRHSSPGGRWRNFCEAVLAAEAAQPGPGLLPLPPDVSTAEIRWAEQLIFGSGRSPADPAEWSTGWGPGSIEVTFSDGTPVPALQGDDAEHP